MTTLHICPQSRVADVLAHSGAGWAVSLLSTAEPVPALASLAGDRRLHLHASDIVAETPGHRLAGPDQMEAFLAFLDRWDRASPLLIHCYAGVSRSTAAAFVALCALDPATAEHVHARRLRRASPTATPNARFVGLADTALGRRGRMTAAVAEIGRGADCFAGVCCALPVGAAARVDAPVGLPA